MYHINDDMICIYIYSLKSSNYIYIYTHESTSIDTEDAKVRYQMLSLSSLFAATPCSRSDGA